MAFMRQLNNSNYLFLCCHSTVHMIQPLSSSFVSVVLEMSTMLRHIVIAFVWYDRMVRFFFVVAVARLLGIFFLSSWLIRIYIISLWVLLLVCFGVLWCALVCRSGGSALYVIRK
jgi:hypothetical protein